MKIIIPFITYNLVIIISLFNIIVYLILFVFNTIHVLIVKPINKIKNKTEIKKNSLLLSKKQQQ